MAPKKSGKRKYNKRRGERRDNQQKARIGTWMDEELTELLPSIIQIYQLEFLKLRDAGVKLNSKNKENDDLLKRVDSLVTICARNEFSRYWDEWRPQIKEAVKASFKRYFGFPLTEVETIMYTYGKECLDEAMARSASNTK